MKKLYLFFIFSVFTVSDLFSQEPTVLTLQPGPADGIDTYICSVFPNEAGYDKGMLVTAWTLGGEPYIGKNVFKFDLSSIPPESVILDAKLNLYFDINGSWPEQYGENESWIRKVTSPWQKMTVCWNNQPSTTENGKIDLPRTTLPQQDLLDIDVKHFVTAWVSDPSSNFGMMMGLYAQNPYNCLVLSSFDGYIPGKRPKLVVTYQGCDAPVAGFSCTINGYSANFQDTSTLAQSWNWSFGDGSASTDQNPVHTYAAAGEYTVSLTIQNSCGSDTQVTPVTITCTQPVSNFVYYPDYPQIQFYDSSSTGYLLSRLWDFGDNTFSTDPNPVHTFGNSGVYNVCLTVTDSCGTDTSCDTLYYFLPMQVKIHITPSETDDRSVQFLDETIGTTCWEWNFGDGGTSAMRNPLHQYKEYGSYSVCLTAGNQEERGTSCDNFELKVIPSLHQNNPVLIYPNPTQDKLYFRFYQPFPSVDLVVEDQAGRRILQKQFAAIEMSIPYSIDLSQLQEGIYFVTYSAEGYKKTVKIVLR